MKNLTHTLAAAALATLAMGSMSGAAAQASATASLDTFDYQLLDLRPDDGIAASVSFYAGSESGAIHLYDNPFFGGTPGQSSETSGSGSLLIDTGRAYAAGEVTPTGGHMRIGLQENSGDARTHSLLEFILAPYTQITFNLNARVSADPGLSNAASASASLQGRLPGDSSVEDNDFLSTTSGEESRILSVSLGSVEGERFGTLGLTTMVTAQVLSPVPEPEAAAMLAAGLGVLGACMRGRKKTGASLA
jgi:hypothetical protein